jgi:heptaprenyl diphosphate synthase
MRVSKINWENYPEIQDELLFVEDLIKNNLKSRNNLLTKISNEIIDSGGKRLRPALVIISAKFGDYDNLRVRSMASAIEILHTATLVHDDVIDKSKIRRGKHTVSEKYGIDMAVYVGDFLFTKSVLILSKKISIEHLNFVADGIKTICEGEVDQYNDKFKIDISIITYLKRISRKTAGLFSASAALGAYLGNCSKETIKSLTNFSFCYGMAFQIRDDIENIDLNQEKTDKPVGNDILEGIITLPVIYAMNGDPEIKDKLKYLYKNKINYHSDELLSILNSVKNTSGIQKSKVLIKKYRDRGLKYLSSLKDNSYKKILIDLMNELN